MHKFLVLTLFTVSVIILTATLGFSEQESLSITTYYPSPYGVYGVLRLNPRDKSASATCETGEMYYEKGPVRAEGLYFCNSSKVWEAAGSRFQSTVKVEFGGMYENGENKGTDPADPVCSPPKFYSSGSLDATRNPCCETGNPFNGNKCGCPTGFTSVCMEMADEPPEGGRLRTEEYCYCYKS